MKGDNFWDDPEWQELRRQVDNEPAPKLKNSDKKRLKQVMPDAADTVEKQPTEGSETREISVKLTVPKITLPKLPQMPDVRHLSKKQLIIAATAVGLVGMLILGNALLGSKSTDQDSGVLSETSQEPEFDTLLPEGKRERIASDRIAYDATKKVASFTDKVGHVELTVSQQKLPDNFKNGPDEEVEKLAKNFGATEVINDNPKAFLGTSAKGPQTVIFHKNGLLVFIYATQELEKDVWAAYVRGLL